MSDRNFLEGENSGKLYFSFRWRIYVGMRIQEKPTELAKREAEVYRVAFEKEKELTDRALRLGEISKPKSNW